MRTSRINCPTLYATNKSTQRNADNEDDKHYHLTHLPFKRNAYSGYPQMLTIPYASLCSHFYPKVPDLVIALLQRLDTQKCLMDISISCNRLDDMKECDLLITSLLSERIDSAFSRSILDNSSPGQLMLMLKQLLSRLEEPPFVAFSQLCKVVKRYEVSIVCCESGDTFEPEAELYTLSRNIQKLSVYQRATSAYIIQRFKRWSLQDCAVNSDFDNSLNYSDLNKKGIVRYADMFADSFVGLSKECIAERILMCERRDFRTFKADIFVYLLTGIPIEFWHKVSLASLKLNWTAL